MNEDSVMSETIDRNKLTKAFSFLASDEGERALSGLHVGLEQFRSSLEEKLNDAEFKYLSAALLQQRSTDFSGDGGIAIKASRGVSAASNLRHGFVINAKI